MVKSYSELVVWQRAMELAEMVYALSTGFPSSERFGLTAQIRRAVISVPSNIAEGHERRSRKEYRRFLTIACGSLAELETQLLLCVRVGLVKESAIETSMAHADEVGRMLRAIERRLRPARDVGEEQMSYELGEADALLSPQPSALSPPSGLERSGVR